MKLDFSKYHWLMIGSNIGATILVSILIGLWLDSKYNTKPKFLLIFLALAIFHTFFLIWNINRKLNKEK